MTALRGPLLPHQVEGVRFLLGHPRCLLLDEPGLGKTIQALGLLAALRDRGELGLVLVATDSLMLGRQWKREAATWLPGVPVYVAESTKTKWSVEFQQKAGPRVLVATYALLASRLHWAERFRWSAMVLDEVSVLKGTEKRHEAARTLARKAARAVGLTATPLENDGCDTWAVLDAVGTAGLWSKDVFDRQFVVWQPGYQLPGTGNWVPDKAVGLQEDRLPELRRYLAANTLRRSATGAALALPVRAGEPIVWVQPTLGQAAALQGAERIADSLQRHKAREAACNVVGGRSAKAEAALQWLHEHNEHTKVLIFAENLDHLDVMSRLLSDAALKHVRIEGKIKERERQEAIEAFDSDPDVRVLLGSSVLERGLNFQIASALLSLGSSWNPAREAQREGRICRIGSPHASHEHVTFLLDHPHERKKWVTLGGKSAQASAIA